MPVRRFHTEGVDLILFRILGADFKSVLLNAVSSGYTASKAASRMIFTPDRRPKIILPATFS
ncbi:MAG: hypothetical protein LBU64_03915, partial [Planctomycetota bacterium]|nr:hypothetical protein [Planctomycetota bacterium]